jgi:hypothetical protein
VDFVADAHHGAADEARLLDHERHEVTIGQAVFLHAQFLEARAAEAEGLGSGPSLEKRFDFRAAEGIFEEIPVVDLDLLLREKLPRFAAGGSGCPAVKIDVHGHSSLFWSFAWRCRGAARTEGTSTGWPCQPLPGKGG